MQAATINIEPRREKLSLPPPNLLTRVQRKLAITPQVQGLLDRNAVVAIGVSGGKDSQAVAAATIRFLDSIGHTGPRVLVHSDLGRVEWEDSLPACERLAAKLGVELLVVRRQAGDMLARWQGRWAANQKRYIDLSCVKVILPWSTPSLRFCTSELKTSLICSELRKRYPDQEILNVTGIRREESSTRAKAPISSVDKKLTRKGVIGMAWNAIIEWPLQEALQEIADAGLELHEAYTVYGVSRVSCAFCLEGATEVVTRDGIKPISELAGGTHELLVPSLNAYSKTMTHGSFKPVEVREFGEQKLMKIVLKTSKRQLKVIFATPEHRWFVSGVSPRGDATSYEKVTSQLAAGDKMKNILAKHANHVIEVPFAVAQGFVFGDGTKPSGDRPASLAIYNNGKDEAMLRYFSAHNIKRSANGRIDIYGLPRTWKALPDIRESRSFLLSWLAGYFAADGCVSKQGAARIDSSVRENIEFARDIAAICGVGHGTIRMTMRKGFYEESSPLYHLNLTPTDLPTWFFVLVEHRKRIEAMHATGRAGKNREQWVVESVTGTDRKETVYCAVVPGAQAFGLADGLMTGNCIMSAYGDLIASAGAEQNHKLYVQMVELEADSGFGFQGNRWLADVAPHLLSQELIARVERAKAGAVRRNEIESQIPEHLKYVKGWPTCMPTAEEAELIARVRLDVAVLLGIEVKCTTGADVIARYAELMAEGAAKAAAKAIKAAKKGAKKGAVPEHLEEDDVEESDDEEVLA